MRIERTVSVTWKPINRNEMLRREKTTAVALDTLNIPQFMIFEMETLKKGNNLESVTGGNDGFEVLNYRSLLNIVRRPKPRMSTAPELNSPAALFLG